MPSARSFLALALCATALQGCSSDSTTAPDPEVTFTTLSPAVLSAYCVQGQKLPGQAISGTLATTDCDSDWLGLPAGRTYRVVWHVRVATTGTYQFAATSIYDNVIIVDHLDSYTATTATLTEIGSDDDSGSDANALLSVPLTAGQDYFVKVIGWADDVVPPDVQIGPYTMTFTGP
jgi:hypothetical protein